MFRLLFRPFGRTAREFVSGRTPHRRRATMIWRAGAIYLSKMLTDPPGPLLFKSALFENT